MYLTFERHMKIEGEECSNPRKPARGGSRSMDLDEMHVKRSYYGAPSEHGYEEMDCTPCQATFRRHQNLTHVVNHVKRCDPKRFVMTLLPMKAWTWKASKDVSQEKGPKSAEQSLGGRWSTNHQKWNGMSI